MKKVKYGYKPPQYEVLNNGTIRVFYYSEQFTELVTLLDGETMEEFVEETTSWLCEIVEITDKVIAKKLKANPEDLDCQKWLLKQRILAYDSSSHVNVFDFHGKNMWLDKATRVGLFLRFESEKRAGKEFTTLWYDGIQYTLPLTGDFSASDVLASIEVYASQCYDNTQRHLAAIESLDNVEDVLSYDYMEGYPSHISLGL